MSIYISLFVIG